MWEVRGAEVTRSQFDPLDVGIERAYVSDLKGGDVAENLRIAEAVLGGEPGPRRDIVLLGAAAALVAADLAGDWPEALDRAATAVDTGRAAQVVTDWVRASKAAAAA